MKAIIEASTEPALLQFNQLRVGCWYQPYQAGFWVHEAYLFVSLGKTRLLASLHGAIWCTTKSQSPRPGEGYRRVYPTQAAITFRLTESK